MTNTNTNPTPTPANPTGPPKALSDILTGISTATGARLTAKQRARHYEMADVTLRALAEG